jgi:DNA-binding GntR family transcriptional regulator
MKRKVQHRRALANDIAHAIQMGEFRAGEWLRQIDLEQKFGATRFDVRSALDELAVRKSIQHIPNRGYRVAELDNEALNAIGEVRMILECAAASRVVANIDEAALTRLRELAAQFSEAVRHGTHVEQSRINHAFHRLFYSLTGNPVLEETIWGLRERSRGAALTTWRSHAALLKSDRDHYAMLEALEARAPERLAAIIADHIDLDRK